MKWDFCVCVLFLSRTLFFSATQRLPILVFHYQRFPQKDALSLVWHLTVPLLISATLSEMETARGKNEHVRVCRFLSESSVFTACFSLYRACHVKLPLSDEHTVFLPLFHVSSLSLSPVCLAHWLELQRLSECTDMIGWAASREAIHSICKWTIVYCKKAHSCMKTHSLLIAAGD